MRLHTKLDKTSIRTALAEAQEKGHVGSVIEFAALSSHGSRTHDHAYEVQLGSYSSSGLFAASLSERTRT